jgi:hypothetical protein
MHEYLTRGFVEYLLYFRDDGDYLVSVKFSGKCAGKIATRKAALSEVAALTLFVKIVVTVFMLPFSVFYSLVVPD